MAGSVSTVSRLRAAGAILILLAFILLPFFWFGGAVEQETAAALSSGRSVALAGFILLSLDALLPIPSSIVATAMGHALGAWGGTLVNAAGLTASCFIGLAVGRSSAPLARRLLGPDLFAAFLVWAKMYGVVAILFCRPVPVLAEASLIALGAGRAPALPVLAAAAVADLCLGAVYAFAGAAGNAGAGALWPPLAAIGLPLAASIATLGWVRRQRSC